MEIGKRQVIRKCCKEGTALILTIFLITAVSSIALSVGKLMASEIKQTNRLEDSMVAYYAAESGIEQGLLMWRYDHDVETSDNATASSGNPLRFDLKDQGVLPYTLASPTNAKHQVYDLKIYYKGDKLGDLDGIVPKEDSPKLYKDHTVEYDVTNLAGKSLKVYWKNSCENNSCPNYYTSVEYQLLQTDNDWEVSLVDYGTPNERKYLSSVFESNFPTSISIPSTEIKKYTLRLRAFMGSNREGYYPKEYSDQLKAAKPYINYAITGNEIGAGGNKPIDSGYTIIESTGYYGSAKQKLQIKINRNSGAILGSYDQVIYTQQLSNP